MMRGLKLVLLFLVVIFPAGCSARRWKLPNFPHPGHIETQRANAEWYDPYPEPNNGYPVNDLRPPGYEKPQNDHVQAQRYTKSLVQPTPPFPPPYATPYQP